MNELHEQLFAMQDLKYRDFHSKLMPTIEKEQIIGIRTPELRKFAKIYASTSDVKKFMRELPHQYYEENNLHGFLLEMEKDYTKLIEQIDAFLPWVNNWATCDLMRPKVFKKHLPELIIKIKEWIVSDKTYVIRFGIEMLMVYYLDEEFKSDYLEWVSCVQSDEYYVNMMIAWYFATALAKQYEAAVPYIEGKRLDTWTHNKTIQKAIESYRITDEQKKYLKTWRVK